MFRVGLSPLLASPARLPGGGPGGVDEVEALPSAGREISRFLAWRETGNLPRRRNGREGSPDAPVVVSVCLPGPVRHGSSVYVSFRVLWGWLAFLIVSAILLVGFPAVKGVQAISDHGESSRAGSHSGEFDRSLPVATLARSRDGVMLMKTELTRSEDRAGLFVLEGPQPGGRAMGDGLPSWT